MHAEVEPQVQPVVPCEPASELECPGRVGPFGLELGGRAGLEQQRRSRNRRADPAEAPPQITPQIEHTEMQARGRLDEYRFAHAGVASRAVRTYSLSSAIASRSRGPAVLSTITWSRANSARIWSAGRRWVRVARIAASSTAWRARLKPRNSRLNPRCATTVTTRARGGVAPRECTLTSRQEHAASSTTPRTAVAGTAGNWTVAIAPCANSMTSSVRFTTAAPVSRRFLNVVVSRNGLMTISCSPHSTPIGAKLAVPAGSRVVRIDSMITAPIPRGAAGAARSPAPVRGAGGRGRRDPRPPLGERGGGRGRRERCARAVGAVREPVGARGRAVEEAVEQEVPVFGEHRFRMKLEADHRVAHVLDRHDLAVLGCGNDGELRGEARPRDGEGVVARRSERVGQPGEDPPAGVMDARRLAVHGAAGPHDPRPV